jgi:hypothetical protein
MVVNKVRTAARRASPILSTQFSPASRLAGFGTVACAADDTSLTWNGITLYGTVDIGVAYQNHGRR